MRRRFAGGLTIAAIVLAGACGGSETPGGDLDASLAYLPEDSGTVIIVSTDFETNQFRTFDRELAPLIFGSSFERALATELEENAQLSFERDIKPLLGNDLVIGSQGEAGFFADFAGTEGQDEGVVGVLRVRKEDKLRELLEKRPGLERLDETSGAELYRDEELGFTFAVEGDMVVFADSRESLVRAVEQRDRGDGLTAERLDEELFDLPGDALVRATANLAPVLDGQDFARFRELKWFDAVRSLAFALSVEDDRLLLDAAVNTNADELGEEDLPLVPGDDSPEVFEDFEQEIVGANRDQSQTTVFLFRAARIAFPDSRFVRDVAALEDELGVDFEEEILRQFNGPSASAVSPDGETYVARSTVDDPDRLREHLDELAPHLPRLVADLEALRSEGMALLFLFAPDAPGITRLAQADVEAPAEGDGLYHVTGLTGDGPDELFFGLVGDQFVVASNEELARSVVDEPTESLEGVEGAGVLRVDAGELRDAADFVGLPLGEFGAVVAGLEANTERLRAHASVEFD